MRELVLFLAKSLVVHQDQVAVSEERNEEGLVLRLTVAPEDVGKVIGKQGRIAKAMRTVLKAAHHSDEKIFLEIS
ncbi:MAG: hypothetical protein DDT34_01342 [Firmicutes bacterium]|nr:hypothetical protein [Bacillota bacterium]MBT9158028.1 hypothetical protein [Bacillota bacterium]